MNTDEIISTIDIILQDPNKPITVENLKLLTKEVSDEFKGKITLSSLTPLLITCVKKIKQLSELKGHEKKEIALQIVRNIIEERAPENIEQFLPVVNSMLPTVIDVAFMDPTELKKKSKKFLQKIFPCLF